MKHEQRKRSTVPQRQRVVVYQRQSTQPQQTPGLGSELRPLGHPSRQGWPARSLTLITDVASGRPKKGRPGFRRLCRLVKAGRVGVVAVSDLSRLARDRAELNQFLAICRKANTQVVVDGIVADGSAADITIQTPPSKPGR
ncbi:MAG TPA: recombinase family protein [archaeon]|nr:recombinase family protein [archaeon]